MEGRKKLAQDLIQYKPQDLFFIQNELKKDNSIKSICHLIDDVCTYGVGDSIHYLTLVGHYIVRGTKFMNSWEEYCEEFYWPVDNLDEEDKAKIEEEWKKSVECNREAFLNYTGATLSDLQLFDWLREQYLAIEQWTEDLENEEKERKVNEAYRKTGINVLEYLKQLKDDDEWMKITDYKGTYIAYAFTGKDPNRSLGYSYTCGCEGRNAFLQKVRHMYILTTRLVDQIGKKQYSQSTPSGQDIVADQPDIVL